MSERVGEYPNIDQFLADTTWPIVEVTDEPVLYRQTGYARQTHDGDDQKNRQRRLRVGLYPLGQPGGHPAGEVPPGRDSIRSEQHQSGGKEYERQ